MSAAREPALRPARSRLAARRRLWMFRGGAAIALALTFGYLPYHIYARSGFAKYLQLRGDLRSIQAQNARLRAENERLEREADALGSDLRALERVARAELGWVRPGEVIFELEAEGGAITAAGPAAAPRAPARRPPALAPIARRTP